MKKYKHIWNEWEYSYIIVDADNIDYIKDFIEHQNENEFSLKLISKKQNLWKQ